MADNAKKSSIAGRATAHLVNIKKPKEVRKRLKLIFQRVPARMKLQKGSEEVKVSLALVDISDSGAGFFTNRMLTKGAGVELSVLEPKPMTVRGLVVWCTPMQSGMHVLKYPFRAGVQFSFTNAEERLQFVAYIKELFTNDSLHWSADKGGAPSMDAAVKTEANPVKTIEMAAKAPELTPEAAATAAVAEPAVAAAKGDEPPPAPVPAEAVDDKKKAA
jgi:hypothetical protein